MLLDDITPFIDVSLSRLTYLSLDQYTVSFDIAFQMLTRCGSLVSCSMDLASQWESSQRDGRPQYALLTLPELKKLSICLIDSTNDLWIPYLSLPNLTSFQVISGRVSSTWPPTWTPAITGSGALQVLLVMDVVVPTTEIEEILEAAPVLTELIIEAGEMLSDSTLRRISSGEFVPRLSALFCCLDSAESLTRHLDMLEARKAEGTATLIEEVVFGNYPSVPPADVEGRIARMSAEGWKICVNYHQ
ncbi:hypothetical protein Hypma_014392 [Hypsizygus marmoreus]|uniref:F-box domain-containing protein n=1 Tax=Hypsizygus marmoreus TaxID=39966 RepID=A0A369JAH1_HYPMA|nr:hypothetical protein Hypma_014392 [Hypsizygus marmoreus]